jgi:hypothetical protein
VVSDRCAAHGDRAGAQALLACFAGLVAVSAPATRPTFELETRRHAKLVEDVPPVRLHGLEAQEQLRGDLRAGLAVEGRRDGMPLTFDERYQELTPARGRRPPTLALRLRRIARGVLELARGDAGACCAASSVSVVKRGALGGEALRRACGWAAGGRARRRRAPWQRGRVLVGLAHAAGLRSKSWVVPSG